MRSVGSQTELHTHLGAGQIITCIQLDDILVDLVPLTLCITPVKSWPPVKLW